VRRCCRWPAQRPPRESDQEEGRPRRLRQALPECKALLIPPIAVPAFKAAFGSFWRPRSTDARHRRRRLPPLWPLHTRRPDSGAKMGYVKVVKTSSYFSRYQVCLAAGLATSYEPARRPVQVHNSYSVKQPRLLVGSAAAGSSGPPERRCHGPPDREQLPPPLPPPQQQRQQRRRRRQQRWRQRQQRRRH
jgi:hypothetical protein